MAPLSPQRPLSVVLSSEQDTSKPARNGGSLHGNCGGLDGAAAGCPRPDPKPGHLGQERFSDATEIPGGPM